MATTSRYTGIQTSGAETPGIQTRIGGSAMEENRVDPGSEGTITSYNRWTHGAYLTLYKTLFQTEDCNTVIRSLVVQGTLQENPFRSICWRIFLNVLPSSNSSWISTLSSLRSNYSQILKDLELKDKNKDVSLDPKINHPLSQAENSLWNQYFRDLELKDTIWQDVIRTFPDVGYFQCHQVRNMMASILFVYAKVHPRIGYRQGMHEVLAVILRVISLDMEIYSTVSSGRRDELKEISGELFNVEYQEHDAFTVFEALMRVIGPWFITDKISDVMSIYEGQPWSQPRDFTVTNKVLDDLNYTHEVLLKRQDKVLYDRLLKLQILPQMYGIRWLRLLFAREFAYPDILQIWDVFITDKCPLSMADNLIVSLLMAVRESLLVCEYSEAVQILMKLPSDLNVNRIISFALHLKDPVTFSNIDDLSFENENSKIIPPMKKANWFQKIKSWRKTRTIKILLHV